MAQGYYEGYHAPHSGYSSPYPGKADPAPMQSLGMGRIVSLTGAALSVVLIVGVAVWSYQLMVRDVSGVPVIRALGGPVRVSHDDPGGRQQQYQGLAVNSVAAQGVAAEPFVIVMAQPPVDLAPEDTPGLIRTAPDAPPPIAAPIAAATPDIALPTPLDTAPRFAGGNDAEAEALLQELVTRLGSPRAIDVDPTTLTPGTRLVQLGIFEDPDAARQAWETMASRNPAWLEGRGRVIEPATSGGRVFYRLRALGFADEPEARRFCSLFRAENLDCIPTLVR